MPRGNDEVPGIFLGIDIGTSGTKTLAVEASGKIRASATAAYPCHHPKPGWSEQQPEDWWQATQHTVRAVLKSAKAKPADVLGIGLSGQMHGSVFLDARGRVIRPALLWNDQRTAEECEEIQLRAGGRAELIRLVGNPALTGFTAPKILWLRNREPKRFERLARVLLPKDYIRYRLTGEFATEVSDASGTLLLDVTSRRWSRPLLDLLKLDPGLLPTCHESEEVTGRVHRVGATETGLVEGTPVVGGGGDQAAGAVGNGIVREGVLSATIGTSGVVFAHSESVAVDPTGSLHTFCHAVRGKWHVMGVILSAGGSLQWFKNQLSADVVAEAKRKKKDPYELLTGMAAKAPLGSEGLYFLPYLTGERTPHADPFAKGAWIGLSPRHGREHLIRSLLEGVTYAMRDSLALIENLGVPVNEIRVSGGGARSAFWRQLQADVYDQPVRVINAEEGPAYGAALLAAVGTGHYSSVPEACDATIRVTGTTRAKPANVEAYRRRYPMFGQLYRALKDSFPSLNG